MTNAVAVALYAFVLALAAAAVWRRPQLALYAFVVGLAAHNATMAALYAAGVRGAALTAITAWKEVLLAVALARVAWTAARTRALPFRPGVVDALALAFGALAVLYALVPQHVLGGAAGRKAVALALRHDVVPVAAFFLGRSLRLDVRELRRLAWTLVAVAAAVATLGLVDVYAVSISWWRTNGVVDYFHRHLGYDYHGTGGLPENFVYNTGSEQHFLRRLVSTFLSPLASAYLVVVALLVAVAARLRRVVVIPLALVAAAGLLWTFTRSALIALAAGFAVLAVVRRHVEATVLAVATIAAAVAWVHVFPKIGPTGNWTKADLVYQRQVAREKGRTCSAASSCEPSIHSHVTSLRDGARTMLHHPQGYGLGNVGQTASRTGTPLKAGESNYTELGAELGVVGAVLWLAWGLAVLYGLVRGGVEDRWAAGVAAAFGAVLLLAVQTDVIGDPWVAYCVWAFAGVCLTRCAASSSPTLRA